MIAIPDVDGNLCICGEHVMIDSLKRRSLYARILPVLARHSPDLGLAGGGLGYDANHAGS